MNQFISYVLPINQALFYRVKTLVMFFNEDNPQNSLRDLIGLHLK